MFTTYLLFFIFVSYASAAKYWLYAGAGGCDSDDVRCVQPPPIDLSTIYILDFDSVTGSISLVNKVTGFGPIWLRLHPTNKFLLAVDSTGGIASLAVNAATGALTRINSIPFPGGAVHMDLNPQGTNLFVASYGRGTIGSYPFNPNTGQIGSQISFRQFYGHGTNPNRQEAPHPHSINVDPKSNGKFVFVPDLGLDIVFSFQIDANGAFQNTTYTNTTRAPAGAGPRHMAFHPTLSIAYLISEMGSTITTYRLDSTLGDLVTPALQTLSTLPAGFNGFNKAAEVVVESTGKWLFASNRGNDFPSNSVAVFSIDANGLLTFVTRVPSGGTFPRGMELSPDPASDILVVGGQDTNNIATFKFDRTNGNLTPTGFDLRNIATPVTFAFVPQQ